VKSLFYSILYNTSANFYVRNTLKVFKAFLPEGLKIHPSGTLKLNLKEGISLILKTNQTSYVTRELFWKGSENYEYTKIFKKLILNADVFFDIGSSIGYYSLIGAAINDNLKVWAFEPAVGPMIYLSENTKINGFEDRIKVEHLALSDRTGEVVFSEILNKKYPSTYNLSGEHNINTKPKLVSKKVKVSCDTLDSFVEKNQVKKIDLMKIDTEGVEDLILKGGSQCIAENLPIIICETLFGRIEHNLEDIMTGHGYNFYNHYEKGLKKVKTIKRADDDGVRNVFFVHPNKEHLIKEFLF
tara:strand:- start:4635 stop:5531 length:897 start_codon:yes stop_codon:yes gene_type:complete